MRGPDIQQADAQGRTVLHFAARCSHGHAAAVRMLLSSGAELEARDAAGLTPLAAAVPCINVAAARALLAAGADPQTYDYQGRSALEVRLAVTALCGYDVALSMYSCPDVQPHSSSTLAQLLYCTVSGQACDRNAAPPHVCKQVADLRFR